MFVFVPNHESNEVCPEGLLEVLHRVLRHLTNSDRRAWFALQYLGLQGSRVQGLISCGQDGSFEATPVEPEAAVWSPAQ